MSLDFEKVSDFVVHGRESRGGVGDDFLNNMERRKMRMKTRGTKVKTDSINYSTTFERTLVWTINDKAISKRMVSDIVR